jgi:Na+-transporting NADH:ubiquinone oxidoreductase subunit NqrF
MSSKISSMFYGVVIHNKWWMCTQFSQMTKYPNNWAFECLTSLLNTFPWISSVCWDKWLIFLFSLLYLVYLKHARIVDTCIYVCVAFTCLQTVWVILKYACSSNQVNIYACVSYEGGRLQLYGSFLFNFF